jgi:hypothetical protein
MQLDRSEGNQRRTDRLKQLKKGPGTFVYTGGEFDSVSTPTMLLSDGKSQPVFNPDGSLVFDAAGRQVFQRIGTPVKDEKGNIVLGGVPKVERIPITTYELQGVKFPQGVEVRVKNPALALKLRGMDHFEEVEASESKPASFLQEKQGGPSRQDLMHLAKAAGIAYDRTTTREELVLALQASGQAVV